MTATAIIPARYASTRFPGKPLAEIAGRPMLQWVWEGTRAAGLVDRVLVATDDDRIARAARDFGAEVVMTRGDHPTGTDRIAEVARGQGADIVVNVQGDEPLIEGRIVDRLVEALRDDPEVPMATLAHPAPVAAGADPNRVKVVLDTRGRALYFSRAPVPYARDAADAAPLLQHIGLYAYRRDFLLRLVEWPQSPAERSEQLEQLRVLENGHSIRVAVVEDWESAPVDVPGDVAGVEARLRAER